MVQVEVEEDLPNSVVMGSLLTWEEVNEAALRCCWLSHYWVRAALRMFLLTCRQEIMKEIMKEIMLIWAIQMIP